MKYKLCNIRMAGNEHGRLTKDVIYAELRNEKGEMEVSATLQYVLQAIRNRKLDVDGVSFEEADDKNNNCSRVSLDLYGVR